MKKESFKHNHESRCRAGEIGTKTCFVTKEEAPRTEMLRFVATPDRQIVFDVAEKLPGRGFWLKADTSVLKQAIEKRLFCKAAKGTVQIPEDLQSQVESALKDRCLNLLGLCRKAGLLTFGYEAVKKEIAKGNVTAVFEASDASKREQQKLFKENDPFSVWQLLSRAELGMVAGQDEVVHVALLHGNLSDRAVQMAKKISLYYGGQKVKG